MPGETELLFQLGGSGDFLRPEQVQRKGLGPRGDQAGADVHLNGWRPIERQGSHGCMGVGFRHAHPGAEGGCSVDGKRHPGAFFKCQAVEAGCSLNVQAASLLDGD